MINGKNIAERMGISKETVSAVLSGKWQERRISTQTRDRVLTTATQMGYVPNQAGRRLVRTRANARSASFDQVALVYLMRAGLALDPVCLAMMTGAEQELSKLHASLTFVRLTAAQDWMNLERLLRASSLDGLLVYGQADDEIMSRLKSSNLPYVFLGNHPPGEAVLSSDVDNDAVGRLAATHLAALGHRRIAYMAAHFRFEHQRQVFAGFRAAQHELGLDEDERLIIDNTKQNHHDVARHFEWLQSHDPMPTAVFVPDYGLALGLYPALRQSPIAALREMSFLGSGFESPQTMGQDYTSINTDFSDVGRCGVSLLHRVVMGASPASVRVTPTLFEGRSTRPFNHPSTAGGENHS